MTKFNNRGYILTLIMHSLLLVLLNGELSSTSRDDDADASWLNEDGLTTKGSSHNGTFTPWSKNQSRKASTWTLGSSA